MEKGSLSPLLFLAVNGLAILLGVIMLLLALHLILIIITIITNSISKEIIYEKRKIFK
jgi:type IV secretory pathway VirB3-like protein